MYKANMKTEILKIVINALAFLVTEVKITVKENGMEIKAVDPAHVAMTTIEIPKEIFDEYEATEMEIGLEIQKVKSLLTLDNVETIQMEYEEENNRMKFKIGNITRRISTIDVSTIPNVKIPELDLSASTDIPSSELMKITKASESISDHIAVTLSADKLTIKSEGDTDTVDMVLDNTIIKNTIAPNEVRSMFPLDYMSEYIKTVPKGIDIKTKLDTDMPLIAEYQINEKGGKITYLLAPRIEEE